MLTKVTDILTIILGLFVVQNMAAQCLTDGHSNVGGDAWISCQTSPNPNAVRGSSHWIHYDFGAPYFLGDTQIWNGNEIGETDRGIKDVVIDYSMDGTTWTELGTFQFDQAPGTNDYLGFTGSNFNGITAQYVLLTVLTTWGDNYCASLAEIKFNIAPTVKATLDLNVFLEGPYDTNGTMTTFLGNLIPLTQPYNVAPYNYAGNETLPSVPSDMVDWVLVEVRSGTPNLSGSRGTFTITTKAGVLHVDGSITDQFGSPLQFDLIENDEYYFCIRHRNHLDVLTANALTATSNISFDFTANVNQAFGTQQLKLSTDNKAMMLAGEFNQDGTIQTTDYDQWKETPAVLSTYNQADGNLDGTVQVTDYDQWHPNRSKLGIAEIGF